MPSILLLAFAVPFCLYAEGTKELVPRDGLQLNVEVLNPTLTGFASYRATPGQRLHISIADPTTEKICFGFGYLYKNNFIDSIAGIPVYYRIKDPNGNIVLGPERVPVSGRGFINTYRQAVLGPNTITNNDSGYNALEFQPAMAGNYYIEFNPDNPNTLPPDTVFNRNFAFKYFDITVVRNGAPRLGRLWSQNWNLNANSLRNPIFAKFFIYSTDSITTVLDCNGMRPFGFSIVCNRTGLRNTGNIDFDRRSADYNFFYDEYKIFLNNPDPEIFPDGRPARLLFPPRISCTSNGAFCVSLIPDKLCYCDMYIELNGIDGFQPDSRDVRYNRFLLGGPNCISWDGNDGLGNPVQPGTNVRFIISIVSGLTNFPVYDAEYNPNGFNVERVRPSQAAPQIYFDDSQIPLGGTELLGGRRNVHPWTSTPLDFYGEQAGDGLGSGFGNIRTLNTWWTGFDRGYFFSYVFGPCDGRFIAPSARLDSLTIQFGTRDVVIDPHRNNTYPNGFNPASITILQEPKCGVQNVNPTTGVFTYLPNNTPECRNSRDTILYFVCDYNDPPLCVTDTIIIRMVPFITLPNLIIPGGFSPNNDGVNDLLVIGNSEGVKLRVRIYNRWGSVVYESEDYKNDWDGVANSGVKAGGQGRVPDGVYFAVVNLTNTGESICQAVTVKR